jgi:hypothetical protein
MVIKDIEGMGWIHLTQEVNQFRDLETMKMNFWVP